MYVCIGVCEGVRPGFGGCGRTKRTALNRRRSKGVARMGRRQGDALGTGPIPSGLKHLNWLLLIPRTFTYGVRCAHSLLYSLIKFHVFLHMSFLNHKLFSRICYHDEHIYKCK
ncbi:hypothetical protein Hanom_Chr01g00039101 [Helianthus anomalus]